MPRHDGERIVAGQTLHFSENPRPGTVGLGKHLATSDSHR